MDLQLRINRINSEQIDSGSSHWSDSHFGLDVEHSLLTTWRPHSCSCVDLIMLEIVAIHGASENCRNDSLTASQFSGLYNVMWRKELPYLALLTREIVCALCSASNALLQARVSTVIRSKDGILESSRILEL